MHLSPAARGAAIRLLDEAPASATRGDIVAIGIHPFPQGVEGGLKKKVPPFFAAPTSRESARDEGVRMAVPVL